MHQITLELDNDDRPGPVMEPEREQRIIALMAQIIVAVVQNHRGEDHEPA
ncbi:MAG: hypothetical protein OEN20_09295 [Gammaproteobacteria bacterium]|jgi:hypothetical protein|nr:hypothetical protein [Gammaproteobacteria bacterium]